MTKATKVTLNSIVFAAKADDVDTKEHVETQAQALADFVLNKNVDHSVMVKLFKRAAALIPERIAVLEEEKAKAEAVKLEAQRVAELEKERKAKEMLEQLVESGIDLVVAQAMVKVGIQAQSRKTTAGGYPEVECEYNGQRIMVREKGNMTTDIKNMIAESGLERAAFIEKYKVKVNV